MSSLHCPGLMLSAVLVLGYPALLLSWSCKFGIGYVYNLGLLLLAFVDFWFFASLPPIVKSHSFCIQAFFF